MIKKLFALMFLSACAHAFSFIPYLGNNGTISSGTISNVNTSTITVSTKITVPNGSAATDATAFGQIFTGFQAPVYASVTASSATTSGTFVLTNLSAPFALTNSSHKVYISVNATCRNGADAAATFQMTILRDGINIASNVDGILGHSEGTTNQAIDFPCSISKFQDSPGDTNSHSYNVGIRSKTSGTTMTLNPTGNYTSTIFIEESR